MIPRTIDHDHDETGRIGCPRCRLNEAAPALLEACRSLAEHARQMDIAHHAGVKLYPEDWSDLYDAANRAMSVIAQATGKDT